MSNDHRSPTCSSAPAIEHFMSANERVRIMTPSVHG
jgi:hypothetical protein